MDNEIDVTLVRRLVDSQFPKWKHFPILPVEKSGWDNRIFHLGDHMLVCLPSAEKYAAQVKKEHKWIPKLAPLLPLEIPTPLAIGKPANEYPWHWSIYRWIEGDVAAHSYISNLSDFAISLAEFLTTFQQIDSTNGPIAGEHSFYRGGSLAIYDTEVQQALAILKDKINVEASKDIWAEALASNWESSSVWVHGDMSASNLLVRDGRLSAVIDFGMLAVGDPACDLAIAWTMFKGESRNTFRDMLSVDENTWARARGWTLWKALIVLANLTKTNAVEDSYSRSIIDELLLDHKKT